MPEQEEKTGIRALYAEGRAKESASSPKYALWAISSYPGLENLPVRVVCTFHRLATIIPQIQSQDAPTSSSSNTDELRVVVMLLLNYITSSGFLLRKWYNK